jgi:2-C-methyl-D-erythritol 4-phosphate cytidylyltransferase
MLDWSLLALARASRVEGVVVALPPEIDADLPAGVLRVAGGSVRSESVAAALEHVRGDLVVIHDAARPLATSVLFDAVIDRLASRPDADGVIAAAPLADTVKLAREPRDARGEVEGGGPTVAKTESRDHLWAAQTPQVFRTDRLRAAYAADPERVAVATDEAMLIEKAGGKVLIEPAPASNLKVTTPDDLRIAELLLASR